MTSNNRVKRMLKSHIVTIVTQQADPYIGGVRGGGGEITKWPIGADSEKSWVHPVYILTINITHFANLLVQSDSELRPVPLVDVPAEQFLHSVMYGLLSDGSVSRQFTSWYSPMPHTLQIPSWFRNWPKPQSSAIRKLLNKEHSFKLLYYFKL